MAERGDLHVVGVAALACGVGLQVRVGLPGGPEVGIAGKDELAPARSEAAPAPALAGLDDGRVALRRARHGEGPARTEMPARVPETAHLAGVGEAARLLVEDERIVGPGIPMAAYDRHELVRAVIAHIV